MIALPLAMLYFASWDIGPLVIMPLAALCGLLLIGTVYWRSKLAHVTRGASMRPTLVAAARWRPMLLGLTVLSAGAVAAAALLPGLARSRADFWVAFAASLLAALEYVNYYHRQLQHFDHLADFRRLLSGRGFRKSQLRRDLEREGLG